MAFCMSCVERHTGLAEQVALLLADVYGMSDEMSAGKLHLPLAGFRRILCDARKRMNHYAGGRCTLAGISPEDAPESTPSAPEPPIRWNVDEDRLLALRRELLKGLDR